jgi:protein-S-isoprenylcysteine O-methyltransferase Ste14
VYLLFFICLFGFIGILPLYFLSLEHTKLDETYGKERGIKIGNIYGYLSGWAFFSFWFGIWVAPQPRFIIPLFQNAVLIIPAINFRIPILHLIIFIPIILVGAWLGIMGAKETTLKTAETHRAEKITQKGVYSIVRHPQYLGGLFSHVGITLLFSAFYSLMVLSIVIIEVYVICWKEERELLKEFGSEYASYRAKTPMLLPRLNKTQ